MKIIEFYKADGIFVLVSNLSHLKLDIKFLINFTFLLLDYNENHTYQCKTSFGT